MPISAFSPGRKFEPTLPPKPVRMRRARAIATLVAGLALVVVGTASLVLQSDASVWLYGTPVALDAPMETRTNSAIEVWCENGLVDDYVSTTTADSDGFVRAQTVGACPLERRFAFIPYEVTLGTAPTPLQFLWLGALAVPLLALVVFARARWRRSAHAALGGVLDGVLEGERFARRVFSAGCAAVALSCASLLIEEIVSRQRWLPPGAATVVVVVLLASLGGLALIVRAIFRRPVA